MKILSHKPKGQDDKSVSMKGRDEFAEESGSNPIRERYLVDVHGKRMYTTFYVHLRVSISYFLLCATSFFVK